MSSQRAVFLDRDGVINALIYHTEAGIIDSPFTLRQFRVLPKVPQAIRTLNDLGLKVVMVSNQPGPAKGHFTTGLLPQFDVKLRRELAPVGARLDGIYYCLHHPRATQPSLRKRCRCRKPGPGMLMRAARDLGISLAESYMIGDGLNDMEAGSRAGCKTIFIGRWKCEHCQRLHGNGTAVEHHPDFVAEDLWAAARIIRLEIRRQPANLTIVSKSSRKSNTGRR